MTLMFETTCQSEVAKALGVSQGLVRHRFIRSLRRMREVPALKLFVDLFEYIAQNLPLLREVQRTKRTEHVTYVIA